MTTIYLIRHAEAEGNIDFTFQGHADRAVTKNGEKQLECLKKRFKKIELHAVYCSPSRRAVDTAKAVNYYSELPFVMDRSLMEICGGAFEGRKFEDLPEMFPEEWELWKNEPHKFVAPGGESMRQCFERMKHAIKLIVRGNMGYPVAVVSHGCALRNYICHVTDTPFEMLDEIPWGDNTCVSRIDFDDKFRPKVVYLNDVAHLSEGLSTLENQTWWRKDGAADGVPPEDDLLHIESGELYVRDDNMDIAKGDLLTPQGAMPLNNVRLRVEEGTVYLRDDRIKLTEAKDLPEHVLVLEDEPILQFSEDDNELHDGEVHEEPLGEMELQSLVEAVVADGFTEETFEHVVV